MVAALLCEGCVAGNEGARMRTSMRRMAAYGVAAVLAQSALDARADELLVMPYACAVLGGRPVLTPAPDQGHPVVGRREQRRYTACSPADPTFCRQWTVHRFTLDCGGVRVPWAAVATGDGAPGQQRAQFFDGRVQLRMPLRWVLPPDDPCARGAEFEGRRRYGRLGPYCAERLAQYPPAVVEMPAGFAPMFGIDAIFVPQNQQRGVAGNRPWTATTAENAKVKSATVRAQVQNGPEKPVPNSGPVVASVAARPQAERSPQPVTRTESVQTGEVPSGPRIINAPVQHDSQVSSARKLPVESSSVGSVASTGGRAESKNVPVAVPQPVPAIRPSERNLAFAAPLRHDTDGKTVTGSVDDRAAPSVGAAATPVPLTPDNGATDGRGPSLLVVDLVGAAGQPAVTVVTGIAALFALLLLMFAIRRQGAANGAGRLPQRDIGAISLGGDTSVPVRPEARPDLDRQPGAPLAIAHVKAPPPLPAPAETPARPAAPPANAVVMSTPPPQPKVIQTDVPRTREDALKILGMGVRPETGDVALKKIVDGLRLTWHPDNAADELDRLEREIRLKQINAAWEIISGKREETPPPPPRKPPPLPQRMDASQNEELPSA